MNITVKLFASFRTGRFGEKNFDYPEACRVSRVLHELDIAAYCKRMVVMRDGQVISDTVNENRRVARDETAVLNQAEEKAKLA